MGQVYPLRDNLGIGYWQAFCNALPMLAERKSLPHQPLPVKMLTVRDKGRSSNSATLAKIVMDCDQFVQDGCDDAKYLLYAPAHLECLVQTIRDDNHLSKYDAKSSMWAIFTHSTVPGWREREEHATC